MILRRYPHADPVAISCLLGRGGKQTAAAVNPLGDIARDMRAAAETGMRIRSVIDTRLHADHLSSGRRLAAAAGASYVLFAQAQAAPPFRGVRDGEALELGNVTFEVRHTPGRRSRAHGLGR